jgi:large subunit ribosomal protein L25
MDNVRLSVEERRESGKGPARRLRAKGKVPAIVYGHKTKPASIAVDVHDFDTALEKAGRNALFDLKIVGTGGDVATRTAVLKERQVRPIDGSLVHLDFLEILMDELIEVAVAIEYEGEPVGLDQGGLFQAATRELRVSCLPGNIPSVLKVDVSGLELGHSIHLGDIKLPDGVSLAQDAAVALASVVAPAKEAPEAAPEEEETPEATS